MSSGSFSIKVYTPKGLIVNDITSGAYFPTVEGQIGVLPQHIRYVGILGTGLLTYSSVAKGDSCKVAISEGVCYFTDDCLTLLAEDAATESANPNLLKDIKSLEEKVTKGAFDDPEIELASRRLVYLKAIEQLSVVED